MAGYPRGASGQAGVGSGGIDQDGVTGLAGTGGPGGGGPRMRKEEGKGGGGLARGSVDCFGCLRFALLVRYAVQHMAVRER